MWYGKVKACALRILLRSIPSYLSAGLEKGIMRVCLWKNSRHIRPVRKVYDVLNVRETSRFQAQGMIAHNCLGLQFSLGVKKLHRKLTRDTGIDKGEEHARELANIHKQTFADYWAYNDNSVEAYVAGTPLRTRDGWFLFCDLANPRSAGNFPIQGAGGAVLRRAVMYAQQAGLVVVSPLHDALYIQHRVGDTAAVDTLIKCMNQAFRDFYGRDIRMEAKTWTNDQIFIEGKGKRYYNRLKEYFLNPGDLLWMEELQ